MKAKIFGLYVVSIILTALIVYQVTPLINEQLGGHETETGDHIVIICERFTGKSTVSEFNLITNQGELHTRNAMSDGGATENITRLAIGNHSTALITDTALDSVYNYSGVFYPYGTVVEWQNSNDAAINCTFKWLFTETVTVNSTATYINNSTYAYSLANFASAETFNNGENLTVRWVHTYNAN